VAVYTELAAEEISAGLAPFELGRLTRTQAVAAGIENTTYFLTFEQSSGHRIEYVLTLGESIALGDMEFVAHLTTALNHSGLPVPAPVATEDGTNIVHLADKPTLLMPRIGGSPPLLPTVAQCHALGGTLAQLHQATLQLPVAHASHKSLQWVAETGRALLPHLPRHTRQLLQSSIAMLDAFVSTHEKLPQAIIHGDLFRDNTLFVDGRLAAIIDFFSAGTGYLLFDLAVVANDWCVTEDCHFLSEHSTALLAGYCAVRPLTQQERWCWGEMLALAALRFWVSRLADRIFPQSSRSAQHTKDPEPFQALLLLHRKQPQWLHCDSDPAANSSVITPP
jgi:homoserine kinase type II